MNSSQPMPLKDDVIDREFLSFVTGNHNYAIDIMSVREIRSATKATVLPQSPEFILGVINLRGTVLPIMDLSRRLGMSESANDLRNVVIVVTQNDKTVGLLVDAVSDILSISEAELQKPPEMSTENAPNYVSDLVFYEGEMVRILNLATLITEAQEEHA